MTIEIPLSQGKVALIDDEDLPLVVGRKWQFVSGYAACTMTVDGRRKTILMHRLLLGFPAGYEGDHIDGDRLNNQRVNLRIVTHRQNALNRGRRSNNASGYKGVVWNTTSKKWRASIWLEGHKHVYLGDFVRREDAALAYDAAARMHFGEFARTNF